MNKRKKLTTDEAAKAMIDGMNCIGPDGRHYRWDKGHFWGKMKDSTVWRQVEGLREGEWTIKKEPIKYSVDVWLSEDQPKPGFSRGAILPFLFGSSTLDWSKTEDATCEYKFRVTVEEVVE